jgi:hypothetical protein
MTRAQIEEKISKAKEAKEQLIAQLNAHNGYIQALEEMLVLFDGEGTPATPTHLS